MRSAGLAFLLQAAAFHGICASVGWSNVSHSFCAEQNIPSHWVLWGPSASLCDCGGTFWLWCVCVWWQLTLNTHTDTHTSARWVKTSVSMLAVVWWNVSQVLLGFWSRLLETRPRCSVRADIITVDQLAAASSFTVAPPPPPQMPIGPVTLLNKAENQFCNVEFFLDQKSNFATLQTCNLSAF